VSRFSKSWMNGFDSAKVIVEFYPYLAATLTVMRRLIGGARPLPVADQAYHTEAPLNIQADDQPVRGCGAAISPLSRSPSIFTLSTSRSAAFRLV
jgi:hypothetical protein